MNSFFCLRLIKLLFLGCMALPIYSDTVHFKSGKEYQNVRVRVLKERLNIQHKDGRQEFFSKQEVHRVRFEAVVWPVLVPPPVKGKEAVKPQDSDKKEEVKSADQISEEERLAEETKEGNEWVERPEEDKINPWGNGALGLIPGYSGLYRTKNYWTGAMFTLLEFGFIGYGTSIASTNSKKADSVGTDKGQNASDLIIAGGGFQNP